MAVSEQRDLRQTSLEYVLLGETTDKDGNEVDLLVVAELRKRDNFRMQRRNGQKGRSLRPSPRELKGLYRNGAIHFVDDGESRFRSVMEALNIDLDNDDVAPAKKAPAKKAPAKKSPATSGASEGLQAMTVAQLREMLKGMGGSIYAGRRQKNKTQLIASIEELQGNGGSIIAPEPEAEEKGNPVQPMADELDVIPHMEEPNGITSEPGIEDDGESVREEAPLIPEELEEAKAFVTVTDGQDAEEDNVSNDLMPSFDINDFDITLEPTGTTENPEPSISESDSTTNGFEELVAQPNLEFDESPIADEPPVTADAGSGNTMFGNFQNESLFNVPDISYEHESSNDPEQGIEWTVPEPVMSFDDNQASIEPEEPKNEDLDLDLDMDDIMAEVSAVMADDATGEDTVTEDIPEEDSQAPTKIPSILFNIPSDDDDKIEVAEETPTEVSRIHHMPVPIVPSPTRRNRRAIPKRRQTGGMGISSTPSASPIIDKISLTDESSPASEPEHQEVIDIPSPADAQFDFGIGDTPVSAVTEGFSMDDLSFSIKDESETDIHNDIEDTDPVESNLQNGFEVPSTDNQSGDDSQFVAVQEDEDDSIPIKEEESDLIDLFDDLDHEGIKTSDDLREALYSDGASSVVADETVAPQSYSGFEFAWSNKSATVPDNETDGTAPDFTDGSFDSHGFGESVDSDSEFDDLDDDLFGNDPLVSNSDEAQYDQYRMDVTDNVMPEVVPVPEVPADNPENETDNESIPVHEDDAYDAGETGDSTAVDPDLIDDLDEPDLEQFSPDGYPISRGTERGLNEDDRTLVRKTFKRMLFAILIIAIIAVAGIAWLMSQGISLFPNIALFG